MLRTVLLASTQGWSVDLWTYPFLLLSLSVLPQKGGGGRQQPPGIFPVCSVSHAGCTWSLELALQGVRTAGTSILMLGPPGGELQ